MHKFPALIKPSTMKTTLPTEPIKEYYEWRKFIASQVMTPEEIFEADFMKAWTKFKDSVVKARTK